MPIYSEKYAAAMPWPMHADEMRERLGFPGRLPDNSEPIFREIQGYTVCIEPRAEARAEKPRSQKPHRVVVACHTCDRWIPFGRLLQHERACQRRDA